MCQLTDQSRQNLWDKNTKQGEHHPEYDSYGKPSWKLKAGESSKPWIDDYVPMPNTYLNMGEAAKGAEPVNTKTYMRDKLASRYADLSSNDSARG